MLQIQRTSESFNVAVAEIAISADQCEVSFSGSPHGGIAALWFHFRIFNDGKDVLPSRMVLKLKHIMTMLGAGRGEFYPVIRYGEGEWKRLTDRIPSVREDGHRAVCWLADTPESGEYAEVAFCYPYGVKEFDTMLKDTGGYWTRDEIGVSAAGRSFFRISNCYGSESERRKGCYLFARQHAAETSGAWVLDGILRRLAERNVTFPVWCVPFADIDGVIDGNYGKDSFPQDINRSWGPHAPMRHENMVMIQDLNLWKLRVIPEDSAIFDFHSPGAAEKGVYSFLQKAVPADSRFYRWVQETGKALQPYSHDDFIKYGNYKKFAAWGGFYNLSEFAFNTLHISFASFETSYYEAGRQVLEIKDYRNIGAIFAERLISYLQ
ncbi:MAG TPA: hypothetical protein DE060_19545 [Lentisphaeria bacterium]|nr:hypothetical protein [Lentisphaeria bacterium]HCG51383.1 hypothetical protein [Lentisphaeria bacterium]